MHAIYKKEWLKLKKYTYALLSSTLIIALYFAFNLKTQFINIEPESMLWYRLSHLKVIPFAWINYIFLIYAVVVALAQFIPEAGNKRVRILMHLPLKLRQIVVQHLTIGLLVLAIINMLLSSFIYIVLAKYYPQVILSFCLKYLLLAQIPALILYIGLIAILVQQRWWVKFVLSGFTLLSIISFIVASNSYMRASIYNLALVAGIIFSLILCTIGAFLSVKQRTLNKVSQLFIISIALICTNFAAISTFKITQKKHSAYYIFYSDVLNDFIYQENLPQHHFNYKTSTQSLTQSEFEQALPFVFWKNLDIQGKLPITIGNKTYNKNTIRASRLSLNYKPKNLIGPLVNIYPWFNPDPRKGAISFPEQEFSPTSSAINVYNSETAAIDRKLSKAITAKLIGAGAVFPLKNIWGKTTNMKPFDWGYFIYDGQKQLFQLRRENNKIFIKKIKVPQNIGTLVYMQVSENRHKQFFGYLINAKSEMFLLGFNDYSWHKLAIDNFNYKNMELQLLANPLHYLIRYHDKNNYYAIKLSKDYKLEAKFELNTNSNQ